MKKLALIVGALALPLVSFAQTPPPRVVVGGFANVENIASSFSRIVGILIPTMFGLAILGFFYGLVRYIFSKDADKEQAKKVMIWGIIAIFVIASIWGIVAFIGSSLGLNSTAIQPAVDIDLPVVS